MMSMVVLSFAQSYKGTVKDTKGEAIPFANVVLYTLPDSIFVEGTTTDDLGQFSLESKKIVKAYLKISSIGYETQTVAAKEEMGTVLLQDAMNELGEVVVKAQLPKMKVKNDAFVTTIQNSVLAKAGNANNVLQRLPMLIGKDGNYTVFGKGKAKIYINNREMRDASELENLNSDNIKSVEIVTNPGARYDASVKSVIRIYTKKPMGDGFSFNAGSSYYQSEENADWVSTLNLNYRKKGIDVFGRLYYKDINSVEENDLEQFTYVDTLWTQKNTAKFIFRDQYLGLTAGANYEISTKHYAGVTYTYGKTLPSEEESFLENKMYANGTFYDQWTTNGLTKENTLPRHTINGYYNGSFGKLDINFDATYFAKKAGSTTIVLEKSQNFADRTIKSRNDLDNSMLASKLILTYPVFKGKLSLGSEYTNTQRDDAYWANQITPSSTTRIEQMSNSVFAEYRKSVSIGQFTAGLRYENIQSDYFVNEVFKKEESKDFSQWFPSFSFSTKIDKVGLQLSYTSKTNRPYYNQLSNNISYINRFTLKRGNPFLRPSITHDVTLGGSWKFFQIMLSYKHKKDVILEYMEQMKDNPSVSIMTTKNFDKLPQFTAFISASPTFFGIWSPQLSLGIQKQWFELENNNKMIELNKPMPFASLNNSFRFPKKLLITLDTRFQGKGHHANAYSGRNTFALNFGITKTFLDDKLSVALKGFDILNQQKRDFLVYNGQMDLHMLQARDNREIQLTIRYKFNSAKSKYKGKGAGKSEMNRM